MLNSLLKLQKKREQLKKKCPEAIWSQFFFTKMVNQGDKSSQITSESD